MARAIKFSSQFYLGLLWIPHDMFGPTIRVTCIATLCSSLPASWVITHHMINTANYGDALDSEGSVIIVADVLFQQPITSTAPIIKNSDFTSSYHR